MQPPRPSCDMASRHSSPIATVSSTTGGQLQSLQPRHHLFPFHIQRVGVSRGPRTPADGHRAPGRAGRRRPPGQTSPGRRPSRRRAAPGTGPAAAAVSGADMWCQKREQDGPVERRTRSILHRIPEKGSVGTI